MAKYDQTAFDNFQKNLTGTTPFDNAVHAIVGTEKEKIETFINESSIFDLQDHFRAAGAACTPLLDLSEHIVSLRMPKKKATDHPIHVLGTIFFGNARMLVGRPVPGSYTTEGDIFQPVHKNPTVKKFFDVLSQLKEQDAKASMILVEGWIEKDLVDSQPTGEMRNAVRAMLLRHQFDIP